MRKPGCVWDWLYSSQAAQCTRCLSILECYSSLLRGLHSPTVMYNSPSQTLQGEVSARYRSRISFLTPNPNHILEKMQNWPKTSIWGQLLPMIENPPVGWMGWVVPWGPGWTCGHRAEHAYREPGCLRLLPWAQGTTALEQAQHKQLVSSWQWKVSHWKLTIPLVTMSLLYQSYCI